MTPIKAAAVALTAIFLVAAIVVPRMTRTHQRPSTTRAAHTTTSAGTSKPTPSKATNNSAKARPKRPKIDTSRLEEQVSSFLRAYFLVKPNDTPQSRRKRLEAYTSPSVLGILDTGISPKSRADRTRVRQKLTISAEVVGAELKYSASFDNPAVQVVTVPVIIKTTKPDGTTVSSHRLMTVSRWLQSGDTWLVLGIKEGGETE